jgi:hypothetical protein
VWGCEGDCVSRCTCVRPPLLRSHTKAVALSLPVRSVRLRQLHPAQVLLCDAQWPARPSSLVMSPGGSGRAQKGEVCHEYKPLFNELENENNS